MSEPDDHLEAERLAALQRTGLLGPPPWPELDAVCRRAQEQLQVTIAMVTLITKDQLLVRARAGTDLEEAPRLHQFCDQTIRSDEVLVVPDATRDPRFAANPVVTGEPFIRFYAGAPLIYRPGIRLGALCLLDPEPRSFSLGDRAELEEMADEVVGVIFGREVETLPRPGDSSPRT